MTEWIWTERRMNRISQLYSIQLHRNFELLSFLKMIESRYVYSGFVILKKRPKLLINLVLLWTNLDIQNINMEYERNDCD
ncbi:hypothetical protein T4A_14219 [Trichinella pseudospiralis]|uniref:Uncharacterized protein n=1 Tax=Trichinella pseudospiralis TaxID=6337 RepID=A0A0V1F0M1_TRIPS|nr:hypothetical protein T4A_14219 [Trichinella pseudospiralis]KRY87866.1 hypothetical protein T4D_2764 [Trichinella pseudospiralis]